VTEEPLTNEGIVSRIKGAVPESTVLLAIELARQRGATQFDTSPEALVQLRNEGASSTILEALLLAGQRKPEPLLLYEETPIAAIPDLPPSGGVYYRSAQGWIALQATLLWPSYRGIWPVPVALRYKQAIIRLADPWASVQVAETQPTFYLRSSQPSEEWKLLQLTRKTAHREVRVWVDPLLVPAVRFSSDDLREVEVTEVEPVGLTLRPIMELQPGEYLLVAPLSGQRRTLIGYGFGVAGRPER
ncbi:MAG: hypothetical protein Q8P12_07325, partial [bacterium]|nr:hypothetical protein [bacterium]